MGLDSDSGNRVLVSQPLGLLKHLMLVLSDSAAGGLKMRRTALAFSSGFCRGWHGPCRVALASVVFAAAPTIGAELAAGIVVDARGTPVAGALVGTSMTLAQSIARMKVQIAYATPPVVTGQQGEFGIPAAPIAYTHALVAVSPDGRLGFAQRRAGEVTRIIVSAPARLNVAVAKSFGHTEPFAFRLVERGTTFAYGTVGPHAGEFIVPQGALELIGGDSESVTVTEELALAADKPSSIHIELQPTFWARNLGKPAPSFTPPDVQNWGSAKPFSSLRGKWVLVDFWGVWCVPCITEMPKLIDFYERNAVLRQRFEIIAVHSPDGSSFAAIQDQYARLTKAWGRAIPFPLLFDATGNTHKRWGVEAYPTTLLLDPQGRIVGTGSLEKLAEKLGVTS